MEREKVTGDAGEREKVIRDGERVKLVREDQHLTIFHIKWLSQHCSFTPFHHNYSNKQGP